MTYRDDRDALLHRVDALEDELERTQREAEQLRADNEKLRTPPAPVEPAPPEPTRALVKRHVPLTREGLGVLAAAGSLVGWLVVGVAAGPALWMLPATAATALLAAATAMWTRTRTSRLATGLPFDHASLKRLVSQNRRALVVKLDVRFDPLPSGAQRKAITSQLARAGLRPTWVDGVLTLASRRLRATPPIHAFVQRALGALSALTGVEIVSVVARAGS